VLDNPAPKTSYFSAGHLLRPRVAATLLRETLPVFVRGFLAATNEERLFKMRNWLWHIKKAFRRPLEKLGLPRAKSGGKMPPWLRRSMNRLPGHLRFRALRYREALARYVPSPFDGRVTLFRTFGHRLLSSQDGEMGWGEIARGGVEVVLVPGDHVSMMRPPLVERLGAELDDCLAAAEGFRRG